MIEFLDLRHFTISLLLPRFVVDVTKQRNAVVHDDFTILPLNIQTLNKNWSYKFTQYLDNFSTSKSICKDVLFQSHLPASDLIQLHHSLDVLILLECAFLMMPTTTQKYIAIERISLRRIHDVYFPRVESVILYGHGQTKTPRFYLFLFNSVFGRKQHGSQIMIDLGHQGCGRGHIEHLVFFITQVLLPWVHQGESPSTAALLPSSWRALWPQVLSFHHHPRPFG